MSIPSIATYAAPKRGELPENKVRWAPDPSRAALLIHDMQEYFLRFYDPAAEPVLGMLSNIERLKRACAARGIPVIYTAQPAEQSPAERGLLTDMWGPGLTAASEARSIVAPLRPEPGDLVVTKLRYSAFHGTGLLELLRAHGRDQLWICGVYAHIGCLFTACDAFMHDVKPFIVADAVADFSAEHHRMALGHAASCCAVTTLTSDMLEALSASAPAEGERERLRREVAELVERDPEAIGDDESLYDLGLDSIRMMMLVERLRARGVEASFVDLAEQRTLTDLVALVSGGADPGEPS